MWAPLIPNITSTPTDFRMLTTASPPQTSVMLIPFFPVWTSGTGLPAVDGQHVAGHEARRGRGEPGGGLCDLAGFGDSPERSPRRCPVDVEVFVFRQVLEHPGASEPRCDGVHANAVA